MGKEVAMKKDWLTRELQMEVVVGAFIIMIFLGLGYFTIILSREKWFGPKYTIEVVFKDVMGLRDGDNVVVRGMTIGKVKSLELDEKGHGVRVFLVLDKPIDMREGYRITIVSTSILGGRYLQIYEGPVGNVKLDLDEYYGEEPYDLMADAAELVNAAKEGFTEEGGIIANLKDAAAQMKEITTRLNAGKGTLGKLLSEDDKLYKDIEATAASVKKITERIERGEGVVGRLIQDDDLYEEIQQVIEETRALIDDFRETAPIVTFTSIFFGAF